MVSLDTDTPGRRSLRAGNCRSGEFLGSTFMYETFYRTSVAHSLGPNSRACQLSNFLTRSTAAPLPGGRLRGHSTGNAKTSRFEEPHEGSSGGSSEILKKITSCSSSSVVGPSGTGFLDWRRLRLNVSAAPPVRSSVAISATWPGPSGEVKWLMCRMFRPAGRQFHDRLHLVMRAASGAPSRTPVSRASANDHFYR